MFGEPARIRPIDIFKHAWTWRPGDDSDPPAESLPGLPVTLRQSIDDARLRDDAPAGADQIIEQTLTTIGAHDPLRKKLAASGNKAAGEPGVAQFIGSLVCVPPGQKTFVTGGLVGCCV